MTMVSVPSKLLARQSQQIQVLDRLSGDEIALLWMKQSAFAEMFPYEVQFGRHDVPYRSSQYCMSAWWSAFE